jgi:hypothetical protein
MFQALVWFNVQGSMLEIWLRFLWSLRKKIHSDPASISHGLTGKPILTSFLI